MKNNHENNEGTREAIRQYVINADRETYDQITAAAHTLTANARKIQNDLNRFSVEDTGRQAIATPEDWAAYIDVVLAEVGELMAWELIGEPLTRKHPTR